ncbi:hypothetical protein ABZ369_33180, partial [Streptomyces sp. NPDC005918]|uniref:hypothetical protein n=1 Tax=Streptomyces sp. NPDC005918 TaxID=3155454 RepID=UPI0033F17EE8
LLRGVLCLLGELHGSGTAALGFGLRRIGRATCLTLGAEVPTEVGELLALPLGVLLGRLCPRFGGGLSGLGTLDRQLCPRGLLSGLLSLLLGCA